MLALVACSKSPPVATHDNGSTASARPIADAAVPDAHVEMVDAAIAATQPDAAVGDDPEAASKVPAAPRPPPVCQVRVTKTGLLVFDEESTRNDAVKTCKRSFVARVILDEGYSKAQWTALERAFKAAKIRIVRGPIRDECVENPLAKGCS